MTWFVTGRVSKNNSSTRAKSTCAIAVLGCLYSHHRVRPTNFELSTSVSNTRHSRYAMTINLYQFFVNFNGQKYISLPPNPPKKRNPIVLRSFGDTSFPMLLLFHVKLACAKYLPVWLSHSAISVATFDPKIENLVNRNVTRQRI